MAAKVNVEAYRGVWVFVETASGKPATVCIELLGKGRDLADRLGTHLCAFLIGDSVEGLVPDLAAYGADRVYLADDPVLSEYRTGPYADILTRHVLKEKPEILIVGATAVGRDLAPRLSMRLNTGCTADCTGLDVDEEMRLLVTTRPAFGGNVMATIICPENRPQMCTVRPGNMPMPEKDADRKAVVECVPVEIREEDIPVKVLQVEEAESGGVNIQDADRLVAIGMGADDPENFEMIKGLAKALDAEVAASRLAVEAGWISHNHQVGQTGKTVKPSLYVACGISGAVQHTAGMSGSKIVFAINRDAESEIFKFADYGIVGDLKKVGPAIVNELNRRRNV